MQSHRHTLIEVVVSTGAAFLISALLQHYFVNPVWHLHSSPTDSVAITLFFTAVSLVRSYIFRRIFNKLGVKK
jgi:Kef-type K+ transport system membrane component KefB